jgi:tetratricopeptide (TPR) repeat protein
MWRWTVLGKARRRKSSKQLKEQGRAEARPKNFQDNLQDNLKDNLQWWLLAAICLVAFLAYARSLTYTFVYDDTTQILRNPWLRDLSQVGKFFLTDVWRFSREQTGNYYRPFHMLVHAAGYALSGLNPLSYHLISILIHCVNTLLVVLFGYRLTRDKLVSAAGGFLFALHPVHAESVSWIAAVTDPLCAIFYFSVLHLHLNDDESKSRKTTLFMSLLFMGALFSKEIAFTLPLVIVWLDMSLGRKVRWSRYGALLASFSVYAALRIHALSHFLITQLTMDLGLHDRILSSTVLMGEYLAKAFIPFNINAFHVFHPTTSIGDPRFLLSLLVVFGLALSAWLLRKDRRILFLFGFIPVAILPVLNLNGIGENVFADRYLYIPSLGSCLLIPLLVQRASQWKSAGLGPFQKKAAVGVLAGVSLFFAFTLWKTAFMWRDELTLFTETLKRSPDSANIASNLAHYYFEKNQLKEAEYWGLRTEELSERAFIKNPYALCICYLRLSSIRLKQLRFPESLGYLEKAYRISPTNEGVLQQLGTVCVLMKNYVQARKWCEAALRVNPKNEISYNNLAFICLQEKKNDEAIQNARRALEIFPEYADAHLNLARGYAAKGLIPEALEEYRKTKLINLSLQPAVDQEIQTLARPR